MPFNRGQNVGAAEVRVREGSALLFIEKNKSSENCRFQRKAWEGNIFDCHKLLETNYSLFTIANNLLAVLTFMALCFPEVPWCYRPCNKNKAIVEVIVAMLFQVFYYLEFLPKLFQLLFCIVDVCRVICQINSINSHINSINSIGIIKCLHLQ